MGVIETYDEDKNTYNLHLWQERSKLFVALEERTSAFPVIAKDKVYYVVLDNEQALRLLVEYDLATGKKKTLCYTQGSDQYISALAGNGDVLVLSREGKSSAYTYKNGSVEYLFDAGYEWIYDGWYIELCGIDEKGVVVFHTSPFSRKSDIYPYCSFDLEKNALYDNGDGMIYAGKDDMAWIEFTIPRQERDPRALYTNENARIALERD